MTIYILKSRVCIPYFLEDIATEAKDENKETAEKIEDKVKIIYLLYIVVCDCAIKLRLFALGGNLPCGSGRVFPVIIIFLKQTCCQWLMSMLVQVYNNWKG